MLAWNQLALDVAAGARRGPTISSRLYALVNAALYDSWALFNQDASGYLFNPDTDVDLEKLFDSFDQQGNGSASSEANRSGDPESTTTTTTPNQSARTVDDSTPGLNAGPSFAVTASSQAFSPQPEPKPHGSPSWSDSAHQAFRQLTMAVAANSVLRGVGAPLFTDPSTQPLLPALLDRATGLQQQAIEGLQTSGVEPTALSQLQQAALDLGQQVGNAINSWALRDQANQSGNYADTTGYELKASVFNPNAATPTIDSTWQPLQVGIDENTGKPKFQNPLTPQWGGVKPFAINTRDLVPKDILRPYSSSGKLNQAFVDEVNQVLNLSMNLSAEQKAIAEFWEAGPGTSYPPGVWMEFTNGLIRDRQLGLDQAVQLSFSVAQSLFDAGIAAWATKYTFNSVRPITAIRQLYNGKNTLTPGGTPLTDWRKIQITGDQWQPYQNPAALTPNFPDVASGHSTFSSAASSVLRNLLGSNLFGKSVTLKNTESRYSVDNVFDGVSGSSGASISLAWPFLSAAAEQAGVSRLYGGIHFNDGNWQGQMIGARVGAAVTAKAQSLFHSGEDPQTPATQQFGTMKADQLTGLGIDGGKTPLEIYGFAGNDVITAVGNADTSLFGGDGLDTFRIGKGNPILIRDLQPGESIQIQAENLSNPSDLQRLNLSSSDLGNNFTDLQLNGRVLAHLDGAWSLNQIQLGIWS